MMIKHSFNGRFPGQLWHAGIGMSPFRILLELKMMEVVVTAIRHAKLQSDRYYQLTSVQ